MSEAIATLGTTLTRGGQHVAQIQDVSGPNLSTDTDEITNHDSPDHVEEFVPTIKRTGEVTMPVVFLPTDPSHDGDTGLVAAWGDRSLDDYVLTYPDGSTWEFSAYVTGLEFGAPVDGHLSADLTLRPSGAPALTPAGS